MITNLLKFATDIMIKGFEFCEMHAFYPLNLQ